MKKELTLNDTVRESIALAFIQLLKKKAFNQITISEIVKLAGVSRSSFYRNFENKEQILNSYIHDQYMNFFQEENILSHMSKYSNVHDFLLPRFQFIKEHRDFFVVLHKNNLLYYVFEEMESGLILLLTGQDDSLSQYYKAMFSGSCAGIIRMWINNGFRESEEDMVEIFSSFPNMTIISTHKKRDC